MQIRTKLKGKFTKDCCLEIPVVIASSDDESVVQAQTESAHYWPTSQRPKRRKGTFFCVTGKNTLLEEEETSNQHLRDQEEMDNFIVSLISRSKRNREDALTENSDHGLTNNSNPNHVFTSRRKSDNSFFLSNNSQFKVISVV